jgi:hypothetical protein
MNKTSGRKLVYWASFTSRDRKFSYLHHVLLDSNPVVSWDVTFARKTARR